MALFHNPVLTFAALKACRGTAEIRFVRAWRNPLQRYCSHTAGGRGSASKSGSDAGNGGPASFARSAGHVLDCGRPTQTIRFNIHTSMSTELSSGRLLYNSRYECGRSGRIDRREAMGSADFRLLDFRLRCIGVGRHDFTLLNTRHISMQNRSSRRSARVMSAKRGAI
jgi:hypothetical protein